MRWRPASASCPSWAAWPTPCDEHAGPTHVTASGIVVGRRGTVLHRHKRLGIWMQPGGHIDPGETPGEAARREATEELGLAVEHPAAGPRPHPPRRPRGGPRPHPPRPALPAARRGRRPAPPARREPRRPLVRVGRGAWPMADAGARRRAARWPGPPTRACRDRRPSTHLLAVQDLDTSITQLQHRRARARRGVGPGRRGGGAGRARRPSGRTPRPAAPRWRPPRRTSRSRSPASASAATAIEQRMYAATSSSGRDLQAMNDEVRHLTERRAELEELELVAMLDQDPVDAELAALRERTRAAARRRPTSSGPQVADDEVEIDAALADGRRVPGRRGGAAPDRAVRPLRDAAGAPQGHRRGPPDQEPLRRVPPRALLGRGREDPRPAARRGRHLRAVRAHPRPRLSRVPIRC